MKRIFLAVPWCCVITVFLPLVPLGSIGVGVVADKMGHAMLLASFLIQVGVTAAYVRSPHKERIETAFLLLGWGFLLGGALFHMSPLHDRIFGG